MPDSTHLSTSSTSQRSESDSKVANKSVSKGPSPSSLSTTDECSDSFKLLTLSPGQVKDELPTLLTSDVGSGAQGLKLPKSLVLGSHSPEGNSTRGPQKPVNHLRTKLPATKNTREILADSGYDVADLTNGALSGETISLIFKLHDEQENCSRNDADLQPGYCSKETLELRPGHRWRESLHSPKHVLAPLVDQSDLPFRLLVRRQGNVDLCFTPMIHSGCFVRDATYRANHFQTCDTETHESLRRNGAPKITSFADAGSTRTINSFKPNTPQLIAQFCGNNVETLTEAVRLLISKEVPSQESIDSYYLGCVLESLSSKYRYK